MSPRALKTVAPFLILIVAAMAAVLLASARSAPERQERPHLGPLVEVTTAEHGSVAVEVCGHGEVAARVTVEVAPEVPGRVVEVHPQLVAGGRIPSGEPLLVVDPRDYELAVNRARASLTRAEVALERERAEAQVAREEWEALHPGEPPYSPLVVREPQVRQAEAELEAAKADLDAALLNLERTQVTLPFDAIVVAKSVDVGQHVTVGRTLATVYGTNTVEVRVPMPDSELEWFDVPESGEPGPDATVTATFAGAERSWSATVARLEARVDPTSRMVHVVTEVPNPFDAQGERPPLLPGTFVEVCINGEELVDVVSVPRHAVRQNDVVWVVEGSTLHLAPVSVARTNREVAYLRSGLEGGEQVVVSSLDAVTDGMTVRTADDATGTSRQSARRNGS
jgi:RND family efflux transporter MFP subunit